MESGESISEACIREVKEETGLNVRISKLVGVYSDPNRITEYVDGNKYQLVTLSFEAEVLDGNLSINEESIQAGYFLLSEIDELDILEPHRIRIHDALSDSLITFIR
jgi:ADP-ribose pyrophosphatase YjhB (NUDIX family)